MNFKEQLNHYFSLLNCTAKELAHCAKLSETVISRYRKGDRIPKLNSEHLKKLSIGISELAIKKNIPFLTYDSILFSFNSILNEKHDKISFFNSKFNKLIFSLNINMSEMAHSLTFDASYLSRIRNGTRRPTEPNIFINDVCKFVVHKYMKKDEKNIVCDLINCKQEDLATEDLYFQKLKEWFYTQEEKAKTNYIDDFLIQLDDFNLEEYIHSINFDKMKIPSLPFHLPTSKNYYGIEEMKKGELDFFKSTIFSNSKDDIFMFSDMPINDMGKDLDFRKKLMYSIALMLKKRLHLNIIHDLNRPFNEIMLGLKSWIPIYMTGQITPYYFKNIYNNNIFCNLNYVSGNVALQGECIKGFPNKGKYYLTNNKDEVLYFKEKSKNILSKAQPLMDIYRNTSSAMYNSFLEYNSKLAGNRYGYFSSLPLYTLSKEKLELILERNLLNSEEKNIILEYLLNQKSLVETILKNNCITDEIVELSQDEFIKADLSLSLSGLFYEKKINYTYEEYLSHLKLTKEYSKKHCNYKLVIKNKTVFKNIQIYIHENKWVMISKDKAPAIHFIIHHPKLCNAIKNLAENKNEKKEEI